MTADMTPEPSALARKVGENVTTLMFRMSWSHTEAAKHFHMSQPSVGRKVKGLTEWTLGELEQVARVTYVSLGELLGDLPDYAAWLPRLDLNQQPFD